MSYVFYLHLRRFNGDLPHLRSISWRVAMCNAFNAIIMNHLDNNILTYRRIKRHICLSGIQAVCRANY